MNANYNVCTPCTHDDLQAYLQGMRYLGIDYGTKKTGLALSDDEGLLAYPHAVIKTTDQLAQTLSDIASREGAQAFVLGHSMKQDGSDNNVMKYIHELIAQLSLVSMMPVHLVDERFSSQVARTMMDWDAKKNANRSRKVKKKQAGPVDDKAAAVLLQRYLDSNNQSNRNHE